jgi:CRISPR-associated endonuclease Cas2
MGARLFLWIVVYDIRDAERGRRVRELLRFNGNQVRACVYEVLASKGRMESLLRELAFDLRDEDTVRVYRICEQCRQGTYLFGDVELATLPEVIII